MKQLLTSLCSAFQRSWASSVRASAQLTCTSRRLLYLLGGEEGPRQRRCWWDMKEAARHLKSQAGRQAATPAEQSNSPAKPQNTPSNNKG